MSLTYVEDSDQIKSLKTSDVIFSYAYLVTPRPEGSFNPGTYGVELIVEDDETRDEIMEYLKQTIEDGKKNLWKGKIPRDLKLPIRDGDDEKEIEAGCLVLKTSSKNKPKLYIRDEETGRAYEVSSEDDVDEIYSGMIGEAVVTFRSYDYNGVRGVKAYINAACKTAAGTPLGSSVSYEDLFSDGSGEFDKPAETTKSSKKKVTSSKKKVEEVEEDEEDIDIDSMIKPKSKTTKKTTKKKVEEEDDSDSITSLDDLLKRTSK